MSKQNLVPITDSQGASRRATLHRVLPIRVDYRVPASLAAGFATGTIAHGATSYITNLNIIATYPNLFQAGASGTAAGYAASARSAGGGMRLLLQVSGIGAAEDITAPVGGVRVPVQVSTQGVRPGREQLSLPVPRSLAGKRKREVMIAAAGRPSNMVYVDIE